MAVPISRIICAMRWAISPETPVSISSKITVGKAFLLAMSDFITNIKRDISPPEATSCTACNSRFLLALNINCTSSLPHSLHSAKSLSAISKRILGIPKLLSCATIYCSMADKAFRREVLSTSAAINIKLKALSNSFFRRSISSSKCSMLVSCFSKASRFSMSSSTVSTANFFCKLYSKLNRSSTKCKRSGLYSTFSDW